MGQHYILNNNSSTASEIIDKTFSIIDNLSPDALNDISEIFFRRYVRDKNIDVQTFSIDGNRLTFGGVGVSTTMEYPDIDTNTSYTLVLNKEKTYVLIDQLTMDSVSNITGKLDEFGIDEKGVYSIAKSLVFHPPDVDLNENQKPLLDVVKMVSPTKSTFYFIDRNVVETPKTNIVKYITDYVLTNGLDSPLIRITNKPVKLVTDFIDESSVQFKLVTDNFGQEYYESNVVGLGDRLFELQDGSFIRMRNIGNNTFSSYDKITEDFVPDKSYTLDPNIQIPSIEPKIWLNEEIHYPPSEFYTVVETYGDNFGDLEELVWVGNLNIKTTRYLVHIYNRGNGIFTVVFDKDTKNRHNKRVSFAGETIVKHYVTPFEVEQTKLYKG